MSSDKLNKVAMAYTAAMSDKGGVKGGNAQELEDLRKKLAAAEAKEGSKEDESESEEVQEAEELSGVEKHKRSKKLDFNEGRGGMRSTIYKGK